MIRIFQIGFNKCGTKSLAQFFRRNRIRSVHWDQGRLARSMHDCLHSGHKLVTEYHQYQFFSDMELLSMKEHIEAFKYYPKLAKENPDALFIYNYRNEKDWVESRLAWRNGYWTKRYMANHDLQTEEQAVDAWVKDWRKHRREVYAFFDANPKYRFIDFNIETHGVGRIMKVLPEFKLDMTKWGHYGKRNKK